jgi:WG containing repeat
MRLTALLILAFLTHALNGQTLFPVKINNRWGLINNEGKVVIQALYEAIGDFRNYGYAVMQRGGKVGLLNKKGQEVLQPQYEDLRVLDSTLVTVMDQGQWMVVNLAGKVILPKGYDRLSLLENGDLAYRLQKKWGVVKRDGQSLVQPRFDDIQLKQGRYLQTTLDNKQGICLLDGKEILAPSAEEIDLHNDSLFFYRRNQLWGLIDSHGTILAPLRFEQYRRLSDNYFVFQQQNKQFLFSTICKGIINSNQQYDDYYPLTTRYVMVKKGLQLGLIDWCGRGVLSVLYDEIQLFQGSTFRASKNGEWALVESGDKELTRFDFEYIAPPKGAVCLFKNEGKFGILNFKGKVLVEPRYLKIELEEGQARAYQTTSSSNTSESLELLRFSEEGELLSDQKFNTHYRIKVSGNKNKTDRLKDKDESGYILDQYEWFFSTKEDRWGLRNVENGAIQIAPTFARIQVEKDLGITLVSMFSPKELEYERTTYRYDYVMGLVDNKLGALVTDLNYWHIFLEDYRQGNRFARCYLANGKFALLEKNGLLRPDQYAYIGPFRHGLARMSFVGRLSGSMKPDEDLGSLQEFLSDLQAPSRMMDFTQYDQLFKENARLICEECQWGYLDTAANLRIKPQFDYALDLVNEVGIVKCGNKWGVVNRQGKQVIPCNYDEIHFLENTDNKIIRLYVQKPKYGLIDTLGQLAVGAMYDQIGSFCENRLAVMRAGLWGYANNEGTEVIPCRFRQVNDFSEGLAAAKLGRFWGYIDKQGNVVVDFKYKSAGKFQGGMAVVQTEKGFGYINSKDQWEIPAIYDEAQDFEKGVARVRITDRWGMIDRQNNWVLRPRYHSITAFNQHGLAVAAASDDGKRQTLINRQGLPIMNQTYDEIQPFQEGMAVVRRGNNYGYIDTSGKLKIEALYNRAEPFSEGRAAVYKDGACGYISASGDQVSEFSFTRCQDYSDGRAIVLQGSRKTGLVDQDGKLVIEPGMNRLLGFSEGLGLARDEQYRFYYITEHAGMYNGYFQKAGTYHHGVAVVQINGKWGIINRRGMEVVTPKYSQIERFENGYAKVRIDGFNGLSNLKGDLIVGPDFEYIRYAGQGVFRVEQGDKIGYFDAGGNWIWSLSN